MVPTSVTSNSIALQADYVTVVEDRSIVSTTVTLGQN